MLGRRLILLSLVLATAAAADGPNPYLVQAKGHYLDLDFERCLKRVGQGAQWPGTDAEKAELIMYGGLCNMGLGNTKAARRDFDAALKLSPTLELPPLQSPRVVTVFAAAKSAVVVAPVAVPDDAPVAVVLTPAPKPVDPAPTVFKVSAPRQSVLPLVLGSAAVVVLAAAIVLGLAAHSAEQAAITSHFEVTAYDFGNQARAFALGSNISYGVAGALALSTALTYFLYRPEAPTISRSTVAQGNEVAR